MVKDCETCKWDYSVVENVGKTERPCRHCHDHVHWEARSPKPPGEFKVGDRVRVINRRKLHHGEVGTVIPRAEDCLNPYHVKFWGGEHPSYEADALEHA